jgi:hypothetical protein
MKRRYWSILPLLSMVALSACKSSSGESSPQTPAAVTSPRYMLSLGPNSSAWHPLQPGDTVQTVLDQNLIPTPHGPMTLVLVHRGPEGRSRELIQLDADGKLMDPKQNYVLRDGDELVFPGSALPGSPPSQGNVTPGH